MYTILQTFFSSSIILNIIADILHIILLLILRSIFRHFIDEWLFRITFVLLMLTALASHSLLHGYKFVIRDTQPIFVY
jgi:hypothetical protein